jgi:lysozyme family protein
VLEQYNGLGYAAHGVPSPYVWSGTDQYHSGKYVRDGVYDPHVVDAQLGCAGLLLAMIAIDPSIKFETDSLDKALDDFTNHAPAPIMKPS